MELRFSFRQTFSLRVLRLYGVTESRGSVSNGCQERHPLFDPFIPFWDRSVNNIIQQAGGRLSRQAVQAANFRSILMNPWTSLRLCGAVGRFRHPLVELFARGMKLVASYLFLLLEPQTEMILDGQSTI